MKELKYTLSDNSVCTYIENSIFIENSNTRELICSTVSVPMVSPNKESLIYISPYEWEEISDLYLYNVEGLKGKKLFSGDSSNIPKEFIWIDDNNILLIIGYPYGTVSVGGDLYILNVGTGELNIIKKANDNEQFMRINKNGNRIEFITRVYTDEMMNDYIEEKNSIHLSDLLK